MMTRLSAFFGALFLISSLSIAGSDSLAMRELADWMHKEASETVSRAVEDWLQIHNRTSISYLELVSAAGPTGVSRHAIEMLKGKGVDVNHSIQAAIVTADEKKFSVIYSELNLHQLGPCELMKVLGEYEKMLENDGVLIIFDVIRPETERYIPRPKNQVMIAQEVFRDLPDLVKVRVAPQGSDWRVAFAEAYCGYARVHGVDQTTIESTKQYISEHDYALSIAELEPLLKMSGFKVKSFPFIQKYQLPAAKYFATLVATH